MERARAAAKYLSLYRVYIFPVIIVLLLIIAAVFRINGSSVGEYHDFFYGNVKDSHLLYGQPQPIRSDEWLTVTPMVASQAATNYHIQNKTIGQGEDMSVILDVPYKNWLVVLRPWNLGFLILPFEIAFSLRWWAPLVLLGLVVYLLALKLFPRKYLFASLLAVFIMLSPLIQWWYRDYIISTLAFGLGALLIAMQFLDTSKRYIKILLAILLGYTLAVFAFIQYPPFQLMTVFPIILFYVGYLQSRGIFAKDKRAELVRLILWCAGALVVSGLLLGLYYVQHKYAIEAIRNTAFPGKREFPSGQGTVATFMHILSSPFSPILQRHTQAAMQYFGNQSEASLFMQYSPLLILPSLIVAGRQYVRSKKIAWDLLLLVAGTILIYVYLFVPGLTSLFRLTFFTIIPTDRFALGIGLLDLFTLLTLTKYLAKEPFNKVTSAAIGAICFLAFVISGLYMRHVSPGLMLRYSLILVASLWMATALLLFLYNRKTLGMAMLAVISLVSVFRINPLYSGLSPLTDTPLARTIRTISKEDPTSEWIATDDILRTYPQANGASSITGNYSYPQKNVWLTLDPNPKDAYIYDRSLNVVAEVAESNNISLLATSHMLVKVNPCSNQVKQLNIKYILTTTRVEKKCALLKSETQFPRVRVYIYQVK